MNWAHSSGLLDRTLKHIPGNVAVHAHPSRETTDMNLSLDVAFVLLMNLGTDRHWNISSCMVAQIAGPL